MSQETAVQCIGIILDGNRRWARARGLPTLEGHRRGIDILKEASKWVRDRKIPHLVVYAFSTENWNRSPEEVAYLMSLFREGLRSLGEQSAKEKIAIRCIGERSRFTQDLQEAMSEVEARNPVDVMMTLWVCLSYGGRAEILDAARKVGGEGVTEEGFRAAMWSSGMPDPDIIIRTGGAQRLSNFLLWQVAYSELFFLEENWPDFSEELLDRVLAGYGERERRLGK